MTAEAVAAYRQATTIEPRFADAFVNLSGVLAEQQDYAEAMAACHRALALAHDHLHALRNLSLCLYRTGRFDDGAAVTVRARKSWPDEVMLHYPLGELLYGWGRRGKAAK